MHFPSMNASFADCACMYCESGEGLDYKAMGSIFSGLVQCGAWGCFDEFNRIEAEVLSVVSSQIRQIQEALKNGLTRFPFEGEARCQTPHDTCSASARFVYSLLSIKKTCPLQKPSLLSFCSHFSCHKASVNTLDHCLFREGNCVG